MSKRKTPAQALEEFLSYYDESILEYRYACDKVVEEDKRLQTAQPCVARKTVGKRYGRRGCRSEAVSGTGAKFQKFWRFCRTVFCFFMRLKPQKTE